MEHRNILQIILLALVISASGCKNPAATRAGYSAEKDLEEVKRILKVMDNYGANLDTTMNVFSDDFVHMAQGRRAVTQKDTLRKILQAESSYGETKMVHEIVTIHSYEDMVLTRGSVKGTWTPPNGDPVPFETNNIITFNREDDGALKVWQVIFNRVALEDYK